MIVRRVSSSMTGHLSSLAPIVQLVRAALRDTYRLGN